ATTPETMKDGTRMNVAPVEKGGRFRILVPAALALVLGGCMVGPDYHRPAEVVPAAYPQIPPGATNQPSQDLAQWWRVFNDSQLDALIQLAAFANLDLRLGQARVREARAQAGVTRSALFPSVNATGEYSRQRLSQNAP